jgi:hypothetical protein
MKAVLVDRKAVDCGVEHDAGLLFRASPAERKVPTEIPEEPQL